MQAGRFRDDLFYRLAVGRIELPPLRRRRGDVAVLARSFWQELGGDRPPSTRELVRRLEAHEWPGNVRELRNAVARHLALGDAPARRAEAPPRRRPRPTEIDAILRRGDLAAARARQLVEDDFERRYIERVLAEHGGNVARAAAASGIARRYFNLILARQKKDD